MKKNIIIYGIAIIVLSIGIISCAKKEESKPLKETQIYGSEGHLPTRILLSFLPQPDAIALVSPSIEGIIKSFYKIDDFRNKEISNRIHNDPTLQIIIKEDEKKTLENLNSLGIDTTQPCAFFYTFDDKWEAVIGGEKIDSLQKIFSGAQKTTLKTSWFWFISGKHSAFWDKQTNIGFTTHNGYTIISNNLELITHSVAGNTSPPSFYYGLNGKPILSSDEIALLLSLSEELKTKIENPKQPFEPGWLKAVLTVLGTEYDEIGAVINPEDGYHEIAIGIHAKQKNTVNTPLPELKLSQLLPENTLIKLDIALTNGLKNFLMQLPRQDPSGQIKKALGQAIGIINSPIFQNEMALGLIPPAETNLPNLVFISMSNQIKNLQSLLAITAVPDEPVGGFEVMKVDLEKLAKLPISFYAGFKDPYVVITDNKDQLAKVAEKLNLTSQEGIALSKTCTYGFIVNDVSAISTFFNSNRELLKKDILETLSTILPNLPEVCMFMENDWYMAKIKLTL